MWMPRIASTGPPCTRLPPAATCTSSSFSSVKIREILYFRIRYRTVPMDRVVDPPPFLTRSLSSKSEFLEPEPDPTYINQVVNVPTVFLYQWESFRFYWESLNFCKLCGYVISNYRRYLPRTYILVNTTIWSQARIRIRWKISGFGGCKGSGSGSAILPTVLTRNYIFK